MAETTFYLEAKSDPRDRLQLEIGDSKQPLFYPQVKMMRWDNEVNFSVRLQTSESFSNPTEDVNNKIICNGTKFNLGFYPVSDGYEFDIVLLEKPTSNVFIFSLNTKNIVAYLQPPLNKIFKPGEFGCESFTETEGFDKNGKRMTYRPERVVGSYALYHSNNPITYTDGKLYRTGKFGHIYRPKVQDSAGNEIWGELFIDIDGGLLTVTLPQNFLDSAVYPIRESAGLVIGDETLQATTNVCESMPGFFASPGAGTIELLSTGLSGWAGSANFNAGIYTGTSSNIANNVGHGTSASKTFTVAAKWIDVTVSIAVDASTNYWLVPELNGAVNYLYDSGSYSLAYGAPTYDTWGNEPSAFDGHYYNNLIPSIHGHYAAAGGASMQYKTASTEGGLTAASYQNYVREFTSLGWIKIKVLV